MVLSTVFPCRTFYVTNIYLFVPFTFLPIPHGPTLWPLSVCIYESVCFVLLVHLISFSDSTSNDTVFASLGLISLSMVPSRSIRAAANGNPTLLYGRVTFRGI